MKQKRIYKSLDGLGVPRFHPEELHWRRSYLNEVESGELIGRQFKTSKGKLFTCKKLTKDHVYFWSIKMDRNYAYFYLPTIKQLTELEQIKFLKNKYPGSNLTIGKGCQLHGDVDATLELKDGSVWIIPWNY